MQHNFHGSDTEKAALAFGLKKEEIINFAANVNPAGFSKKAAEALKDNLSVISAYPDREYNDLKASISEYTGCKKDNILLGSGVTELLSVFTTILSPKDAALIGPTYSEYEKDLLRLLARVHHIDALEDNDFILRPEDIIKAIDLTGDKISLLILCNPNNPTGFALKKDEIKVLADELKKRDIILMIDETYAEFSGDHNAPDDISAISLTDKCDNILVLRGTSKFFSTPGLRLGYAVTSNAGLIDKYLKQADPWSINSVASLIGSKMFTDDEYISGVKKEALSELTYLKNELSTLPGVKVYPTKANFILIRLNEEGSSVNPDSHAVFEELIKQGLMVRDCSTFSGMEGRFIRICYMKHGDNVSLVAAMKKIFER